MAADITIAQALSILIALAICCFLVFWLSGSFKK